ncbi:MAG TPA: metallophosphoesterase [Candidatus Mediterraneibacter merdipullorum]|nr:metallophosphoesterase [Candidatus Mediterraneibacter merdipullorum]
MKVLVIPDVHLKPWMFERADKIMEQGVAERAVCLMDIPDDWNQEYNLELYMETFDAAITFAKKYPETLWAYGNHDLSYIWNEPESGYSLAAAYTVAIKLDELAGVLPEGNEIRYIQKIDNVLFCHGGLRDYFVKKVVPAEKYHDVDEVVRIINDLPRESMWSDVSPIWHRPQYTAGKMYGDEKVLQVVGHTPMEKIYREGNVISCDVFSTYRDGRAIGTEEFAVVDTESWEYEGSGMRK